MKLTLKKTIKDKVVDETVYTFNDLETYLSFFNKLGVDIDEEDAIDDLNRPEVTYRLPVMASEIQ